MPRRPNLDLPADHADLRRKWKRVGKNSICRSILPRHYAYSVGKGFSSLVCMGPASPNPDLPADHADLRRKLNSHNRGSPDVVRLNSVLKFSHEFSLPFCVIPRVLRANVFPSWECDGSAGQTQSNPELPADHADLRRKRNGHNRGSPDVVGLNSVLKFSHEFSLPFCVIPRVLRANVFSRTL